MKKLLSILTSVSLVAVGATSVVSCSVPKTKINVSFDTKESNGITYSDGKYKVGDAEYTPQELDKAMQGNFALLNQSMPVAMSFDQLNSSLLNLISFNQSLVVKTQKHQQQLRDFRDTFLGRNGDTVSSNGVDTVSVDGIKFKNMDTDSYYKNFSKTYINSLTGLFDLYKNGDNGLTGAAKASYELAKKLFENNSDAENFIKDFANSKKNPAFTDIKYDVPLSIYNSQSQIMEGFDTSKEGGVADTSKGLTLGSVSTYAENNSDAGKDNGDSKKITDNANSDPYGAIVITPKESKVADKVTVDSSLSNLSYMQNKDDNLVLREHFADEKNHSAVNYFSAKKDGKYALQQNIGEYLIKSASDLGVTYTYQTDMNRKKTEPKKDSTKYEISFKLTNLVEIYSPIVSDIKGLSVKSITSSNTDGLKVVFNGNAKDKIDITNLTGTWSSDGTTYTEADNKKAGTFSFKLKDFKGGKQYSYNYDADKTTEYSTSQLSWIFRGYKFMDESQMKDPDEFQTDFVKTNTDKKGKSLGSPVRDKQPVASDITHNMRDIKTTGIGTDTIGAAAWTIKKD